MDRFKTPGVKLACKEASGCNPGVGVTIAAVCEQPSSGRRPGEDENAG